MGFITCARCQLLRNSCSYYTHQVKGLKAFVGIMVFLKNDNSILKSSNVTFLVEAKNFNTPNSSVIDLVGSTMIEANGKLL